MSYVAPCLQSRFNSLSAELKEEILKRNVKLYSLRDLVKCLEDIVAEG